MLLDFQGPFVFSLFSLGFHSPSLPNLSITPLYDNVFSNLPDCSDKLNTGCVVGTRYTGKMHYQP